MPAVDPKIGAYLSQLMQEEYRRRFGMKPVWAANFDNSPRHCWLDREGKPRLANNFEMFCEEDHSDNYKVVDKVEWMRFIHIYGEERFGEVTFSRSYTHEENPRESHVEVYEDFKVFLSTEGKWARIECFNPMLLGNCINAYDMVQESYPS